MNAPAQNPNAEGLRDDTPVCPFCNSARHDSERLRDGNVMQTADLVDAMLNVWLNTGEPEFPADLNRKPQFPQDYSDGAQSLFRAKMKAALGTAIRNMPYLAALRDIADTSLEWAGEMRGRQVETPKADAHNRAFQPELCNRAIMRLEAEADAWLADAPEFREIIRQLRNLAPTPFRDRAAAQLDAVVRNIFVEAFYRGFSAHKELAEARLQQAENASRGGGA